jgi:serine/threonine protein kinase/WD40 repeat protein
MAVWNPRANDLFLKALEAGSPEERRAYLDGACGGEPSLRAQVEALLAASEQAGNFLQAPAEGLRATADEQPLDEAPGAVIGPYKLLELIGEGGMGAVWMAEQREPMQRKVALKIIKAGMDTRQVVARFEAERQALALMDHANIAKVLDGGTTAGGRPYFVMELVKGTPITRYCDEHRLTPRERLELFVPVCQAIQHAHQKGIIHRDVKPSNVLVAPYDGRPVPKVIDFGVAKATGQRLTERTLFTGFGAVLGTLEYMSPEQAELNNQDIDTRSDLYSLGVLLYELLTGTTPLPHERLTQAAFTETLRLIREEEPPRPSTRLSESGARLPAVAAQRHMEPAGLTRLVRGELDWIVMKALEKDRRRRYETVNGLALDVQHYLADEPVKACPPTVGYRLRKVVRRHRGPLIAAGLVLLALVAGVIGTTWGLVSAERALSELQDQQNKTRAAEATARDKSGKLALLYWKETRASRQARQPGVRYSSLEALTEAMRQLRELNQLEANRPELRDDAIATLALWDVRPIKHLPSAPGQPHPCLDPLGEYYAAVDAPTAVSWRRLADDQVVHRWQWDGLRCDIVDVSPDGRYVAAFCQDDREKEVCRVWDSGTGSLVFQRPIRGRGHAFRPDGKVLALDQGDSITLCDLGTGRDLPPLPVRPGKDRWRFHPSGQYLAVSYRDPPGVEVWDLAAGKVVCQLPGAPASLAWSPDGSLLALGSPDTNIYLCAFPGGKVQAVLRGHEHVVTWVEFHPSGRLLASCSHDDTTRLWCFAPGGELVLPGEQLDAGFSRDGRRLVTWSRQGGVTAWEVADPGGWLHYLPHGDAPDRARRGVAFAPDGRLLASASQDGALLWDAAAARLVGRAPSGDGVAVAFHPREPRLFTAGSGGLMQWPIVPERDGRTLRVGPGTVLRSTTGDGQSLRIAVAATGERLLLGAGDGGLDLVPLAEPGPARRLGAHDCLSGVALSPDGRWAASAGGADDAVCVWDVARGAVVRRFPYGGDAWCGATFSPDGRWLVIAVRTDFRFLEVGSWEEKARLERGPQSLCSSVTFTPDGRLLAVVDGRKRVQLYDVAGLPPRRLATLEIPGSANVSGLSLSPDGARLAANTEQHVIALWDLRRLRQELAALDLDWETPPYPPAEAAGEPVQPLTVEIQGAPEQK